VRAISVNNRLVLRQCCLCKVRRSFLGIDPVFSGENQPKPWEHGNKRTWVRLRIAGLCTSKDASSPSLRAYSLASTPCLWLLRYRVSGGCASPWPELGAVSG